jgi:hypothetical protein
MQLSKNFFSDEHPIALLGKGEIGGKAKGLELIHSCLYSKLNGQHYPDFRIGIPKMVVLTTEVFDSFMDSNKLWPLALSNSPDDTIALKFQKTDLPFSILADLRLIATEFKTPLAIRSSSLLEDAMHEPFAGIYGTKMTPNNQFDVDTRFHKLVEAIKYVYASTFFKKAKDYIKATNHSTEDEKMAVIIQEVVGSINGNKFYPEVSGVGRSYNFYPLDNTKSEDGIVNLAFGLGKTVVDGGVSWSFSPAFPQKDPPFKSMTDMLKYTQLKFWSINIGTPPEYNPVKETEFLFQHHFMDARKDNTLDYLVSSYDPQSQRLWIGMDHKSPLILTFSPILKTNSIPLNELLKELLNLAEDYYNTPVEIEFAVSLSSDLQKNPHKFGFLQVRPLVVSSEKILISEEEMFGDQVVISSNKVLGNGQIDYIKDIVFVKPETFETSKTYQMTRELEQINENLVKQSKPYLLIGYGRWGTTDAWAGIPVDWSQISGAKVIVEASKEGINQDMSQGSHFFHNVTSFQILYFSVPYPNSYVFKPEWFSGLNTVNESKFLKHVTTEKPLLIKADGKTGKGIILTNL